MHPWRWRSGIKSLYFLRISLHTQAIRSSSKHFFHLRMMSSDVVSNGRFPFRRDRFKGVTIDMSQVTYTDEEFEKNLKDSLESWKLEGVRCIWFSVPLQDSSFVPILVKHGFQYHHARRNYVMMTKWLPTDEPYNLPSYPFTFVGVGGLVVNDENQILVVQEKYHDIPRWKLPGGYANPGEDFADTAKREVLEETGIKTEFVSVVAMRHHHRHYFGCSDIYVVCEMKPLSLELKRCTSEITECVWMDVEDYRTHPSVTDLNRFVIESYLSNQKHGVKLSANDILAYTKDITNKVYSLKIKNNKP